MRRSVWGALALVLACAGGAAAQVPLKPDTPMILTWTPQQQADGYRAIETLFHVNTIHRGGAAHPLPRAARPIDPTFDVDGKAYTVESFMAAHHMSGVLVLKDGKILLERYAMGRKPEDRWTSFSVAKSVTSTLVGAAIADGKIAGLNAPVVDYIPELKGSAYEGVTVRQLLMMSSGVKWNEDYADPRSDVAQAGAAILDPGVNPMVSYMRRLPRAHEPGAVFHYDTGETDLVGVLVSKAVGMSLADYASAKIWKPYGMERDAVWMTDLGGQERGGCCISMTLRDYGRVGQFILDGGVAGTTRILPPGWTAEATSKQIDNGLGGYGYFWWMVPDGYQAAGIFGQSITTYPKDRVIVVTNAAWAQADADADWVALGKFDEAMRAAANGS